ncbi:MAG TPA: AMP-binding protein [Candidatus Acidoferrum sp.]|nr:AMP-binding protein [Candidatus Acidoferrum sp.]
MQKGPRFDATTTANLATAFFEVAEQHAHRPALIGAGGQGPLYTYGEVGSLVRRLARGLQAPRFAGVREIGILSENRPEWPIAYLSILAAGKTVVPIDSNLKPAEIVYVLNHSGLTTLFASGKYERMLGELGLDLQVYLMEEKSPHGWQRLMDWQPEVEEEPAANSTAVLIYTSGTTGNPRGVILTHENLMANLEGIRPALPFDESDIFLSILPLHHTYEATCGFLAPLLSGSTVVYARSLKSKEILADLGANRVTVMTGVPLLYEKIYHTLLRNIQTAPWYRRALFHSLFFLASVGWSLGLRWGRTLFSGLRKRAGLQSIRLLVSGGAALPPEIARFFNLVGVDFLQGYGMTECSPVVSSNRPDNIKFGSVGPPLGNIDVRIDHPDENGIGEIIIRGPSTTPGYRANPEKTAELLRDGWLHTGDLGRLKDGHLWITGRIKNVIVSAAGKNIYPEELEEKLSQSPYILEVVVFGRRKDAKQGEEVRAILVPDLEQFHVDYGLSLESPDMTLLQLVLEQEVGKVNQQMADFKRISGFDIQIQELEKTSTKKVKRFVYNEDRATS